jgi:hypothetical protein
MYGRSTAAPHVRKIETKTPGSQLASGRFAFYVTTCLTYLATVKQ